MAKILSYAHRRFADPAGQGSVQPGNDLTSHMISSRIFLDSLYRIAVAAAHPASCLVPRLPDPPSTGRIIVLAAGKAAGSMTEIAERHYLDHLRLSSSRL